MKSDFKKKLLVTALAGLIVGCGGSGGGSDSPTNSQQANTNTEASKYSGKGVSTGAVTRKSGSNITVNGTKFDISSASINLDGTNGTQSDIKLGQVITVNAEYNADGTATATELVYDDSLQGPVDSVDVAGKSFVVLGQTILVNEETIFEGTNLSSLKIGQIVEISGISNNKGQWQASYIGHSDQDLGEFDLIGTVSQLDVAAMTFSISQLLVDYSQADNLNAVQALLAEGVSVEIYGSFSQSSTGKIVLQANDIELVEGADAAFGELVEVEGLVTKTLSENNFEVAGVKVSISEDTLFEFGDVSLLVIDANVQVEGTANEDGSIAAKYIFVEPDNEAMVTAKIEAIDLENNTVTVLGKTYRINASSLLTDNNWDEDDFDEGDFDEGDFDEDSFDEGDFGEDNLDEDDFDEGDFDEDNLDEDDFDEGDFDEDNLDEDDFDEGDFDEDSFDEDVETLALADLKVGDYVEIISYHSPGNNNQVAVFLGRIPANSSNEIYLSAKIDSIQSAQKTIVVMGQIIDLTKENIELYVFDDEMWTSQGLLDTKMS